MSGPRHPHQTPKLRAAHLSSQKNQVPRSSHSAGRKTFQKSSDKKGAPPRTERSRRRPIIIRQWHQPSITRLTRPGTGKHARQQHITVTHLEEEDPTNLQELGMNLSGSQDKPTLTLTIPRSNQVVYKGFPSATQSFRFERYAADSLPNRTTHCATQGHDPERQKSRLLSNHSHSRLTFRRFPARLPA